MKKELMITFSGIKKKKINSLIILLLISFAVMLIYIAINSFNYTNKLGDSLVEKAKSPDFIILTKSGYDDELEEKIRTVEGVYDYEANDTIFFSSAMVSSNSFQEEMSTIIYNFDEERKYDIPNLTDTKGQFDENSIILPYYLHVVKNIDSGDTFKIESASGSFTYTVYGFIQDVYFSNPSNMTMYKTYVNDKSFQKLEEVTKVSGSVVAKMTISCVMANGNPTKIENGIVDLIGDEMGLQFIITGEVMKSVSFIYVQVLASIILLFAVIIITVILVVIRFSIISHIDNNMKNLGTLSAVGYTSKQLRLSSALEFAIITVIAGVIGILSSFMFSGFVGNELSKACGMKWRLSFNPIIAIATYFCVLIFVVSISYISTRKFKKITPLAALRNGIETHNYKKNKMPLEKSKFGVNLSLGIKNIFSNGRQNILILIIVILLSFTCLVTITFSNNFSSKSNTITKIVGMEKSNIQVYIMNEENTAIFNEIKEMKDVRKTIIQKSAAAKVDNGSEEITLTATSFSDFENLEINTLCKGRLPKEKNEVLITYNVAKDLGVGVGDMVNVKGSLGKKAYYVTGICQQMNNMGLGIRITQEGFNEICKASEVLLVYLNSGSSNSEFVAEARKQFKNRGVEFYDVDEVFKNVTGFISDIFNTISLILSITTYIVIGLITFLIIKMKLLKDKKIIGIYKAIGYTTGQIIFQTIVSLLPVIFVGAIVGVVLSQLTCNSIFALCLSSFGIKQINLDMYIEYAIIGIVIMIFLSLGIALVCSARVKKIEPYTMIVEI